ncbi:MAG: hypothetical protein KJ709_02925 [Nanoarchaeota archaeon]|nr:hypothetical protein [Nanoarchaeota archaeon]
MVNIFTFFLNDIFRQGILADFERELGVPHQTIRHHLDTLVDKNLINRVLKVYSLNLENPAVWEKLSIAEKERLLFSLKDTIFSVIYEKFSDFYEKGLLIMFGSAVTNIKEANDIDLLYLGKGNPTRIAKHISDAYGKEIHLVRSGFLGATLKVEIQKRHIFLNRSDEALRLIWYPWIGARRGEKASLRHIQVEIPQRSTSRRRKRR